MKDVKARAKFHNGECKQFKFNGKILGYCGIKLRRK
jgi:hypothetical protein